MNYIGFIFIVLFSIRGFSPPIDGRFSSYEYKHQIMGLPIDFYLEGQNHRVTDKNITETQNKFIYNWELQVEFDQLSEHDKSDLLDFVNYSIYFVSGDEKQQKRPRRLALDNYTYAVEQSSLPVPENFIFIFPNLRDKSVDDQIVLKLEALQNREIFQQQWYAILDYIEQNKSKLDNQRPSRISYRDGAIGRANYQIHRANNQIDQSLNKLEKQIDKASKPICPIGLSIFFDDCHAD